MHISLLPEELFEEIFSYLQLEDLLSCCSVSKYWRNVINKNKTWFKLCHQRSPVKKNNFELIESPFLVDPIFIPPAHTCNTLEKICPWRLRFMQEAHISKNWRYGRFTPYPITRALNQLCTECDDDILLVFNMERRELFCYNIISFPRLVQVSPFSMRHVFADFLKLCGGKLVVVQCTLVQVYSKNENNDFALDLSHRFLFNKSELASSSIPDSADITDWYNTNIKLYPSDISIDCDHNGEYFVGLVHNDNFNKVVLHIWNIKTGHKAAEQLIPETDGIVIGIHFSLHSSDLRILMKLTDGLEEHTVIRSFNLITFKYTNLHIIFNYVVPIVLFGPKLVMNIDNSGKTLWLWKNEDGSFKHKLTCDFIIHPATLHFVSSMIIVAGNSHTECSGTVKALNTDTFQTVCEFVADYRINNLLFVRANLVLVCGWLQLGLWDMSTATKVHTLVYHDCLWVSPGCTKSIVENDDELIILHFW